MSKILIIEDEDLYRIFLKKVIERKYECDTANSGDEAKELLLTNTYAVVLYDLRLPGISGRELIQFVKKEVDPDIVNIVITGFEEDWTPIEATEENIFFYLKKGYFHPNELLKIIDSAFQLRNLKLKEKRYISELIASEKIAQAGKLATGIAHEINNPLQSLVLVTGLLKNKLSSLKNSEDLLADLLLIETGVERIRTVVKQLLDLYRIDSNPTGREQINTIIEKAVSFLSPIGKEQHTEITFHKEDQSITAYALENQFFYVLINIGLTLLDYQHEIIEISSQVQSNSASVIIKTKKTESEGKVYFPAALFGIDISKGIFREFNGTIDIEKKEDGEVIAIILPLIELSEEQTMQSFEK